MPTALGAGFSKRTRNVVLTDHQAELIEDLVATGRFQNASEVLREGIRLVEQRMAEDRARVDALRSAILVDEPDIDAVKSKVFKGAALRNHLAALPRTARTDATPRQRRR